MEGEESLLIAFTTMMWMAEVLSYDTAPMEGFFEDKVKSVLEIPDSIRVVALLGLGRLKGADKRYAGPPRHAQHLFCGDVGGRHRFISVGVSLYRVPSLE
jgi:nitroreductase